MRCVEFHVNVPERFCFEGINLLVTFNDEAKCRELTRSITNHSLLLDHVSQEKRLESGERGTNSQIDFLSDLNRI